MSRLTLLIVSLLLSFGAGPAPSYKLSDLVRVRLIDNVLQIEWRPRVPAPHKPIPVTGPEARWMVRSARPIRGAVPGTLELERPPAGTRDRLSFWSIFVSSGPNRLYITGHRGGRAAMETTVRFTQTPDGVVQLVVLNNVTGAFTQANAASVVELRQQNPQLVRQFLTPLLRQISDDDPLLPGATDVYVVFDELSPDAPTQAAVEALIPELANPSFQNRETASAQLAALGPVGVCAVMRMERSNLLPEQTMRLENLLAINSHRKIDDAPSMRRDPAFLADCLEFDDDRVRWLAKRQLEQLLGKPIPMHHAPTSEEWSQAADLVRSRLAPSPP